MRRPGTGQAPDTALKTPYAGGQHGPHKLKGELIRMSIMTREPLTPIPAGTGVAQTWASLAPRAGWYEDQEQKDNDLGPMPDETEVHQLVGCLVVDGDDRARTAGRRARRTFADIVFKTSEQARGYAA